MKSILMGIVVLLAGLARGDADALYRQGAAFFETDPAKACELFVQAAEAGNVSAMAGAGHCFETGTGTAIDYARAIGWYEKAVAQNSLNACEGLARTYASCPDPAFHDGEKAVKFAGAVARKKPRDAEALALLATAYARNFDFRSAVETATKASFKAGSIEQAKEIRGKIECLKAGQPIPAIAREAWMIEAANCDSMWAIVKMAKRYADRADALYNPELAVLMCQKGIEAGDRSLYPLVADVYYFDEDSFLNLEKAADYYKLALRHDCYEDIEMPLRVKYLRCFEWEAKQCIAQAERARDGYTYTHEVASGSDIYGNTTYTQTTVSVPPDPKLALFYFTLARKKGHFVADAEFARIQKMIDDPSLASGRHASGGGPLSEVIALRKQAIACRNAPGDERDIPKAIELYKQAYALKKEAYDAFEVGNLYLWEKPYRDYGLAREWLDLAIKQKFHRAHLCLAEYYYRGYDKAARDAFKAIEHAQAATELEGKDSKAFQALASAYAYGGQFDNAAKAQKRAVDLFEVTDRNERYYNALKSTLERYRKEAKTL